MDTAPAENQGSGESRPRKGRSWWRVLGVALATYVIYCAAMFFMQTNLIFPGWKLIPLSLADAPPTGVQSVWITAQDGSRVEAWYARAPRATSERPAPAAIYFHGNGEVIDWRVGVAKEYARVGVSTLLVEYRGYGRSEGTPSQAAVAEDAIAFRAWLCEQPEVDCERLVYHGRSLGGGAAVELARTHEPRALIVESTFTSISNMAWKRGVPGFLVRSPFRNDVTMPKLGSEILILHGAQDNLIPVTHGRRLHAIAPGSRLVEIAGSHNDFPRDYDAYIGAIQDFLKDSGIAEATGLPEPD